MNRNVYKVKRIYQILKKQGLRGVFFRIARKIHSKKINEYIPETETVTRKEVDALEYQPLISIVLPVYNPDVKFLRAAIDSILAQSYSHWELCVADDASTHDRVKSTLIEYEKKYEQIKVSYRDKNEHIAACSNSALKLATGKYIALLDHDDVLFPDALYYVVQNLQGEDKPDVLFSNEVKIDEAGLFHEQTQKPQWARNYFYSMMYVGHLTVYNSSVVKAVNGFRVGSEGSQDYDLLLRIMEKTESIKRISQVLYGWREVKVSVSRDRFAKQYAYENGRSSLERFLKGFEPNFLRVEETLYPGVSHVRFKMPKSRDVRIFNLKKNNSSVQFFEQLADATENYLFLNDLDYLPSSDRWTDQMIEAMQAKDICAVTPLRYSSKKHNVISAGFARDRNGRLSSPEKGLSIYEGGEGMMLVCKREVEAAPLSCFMVSLDFFKLFLDSDEFKECKDMPQGDIPQWFSQFSQRMKKTICYVPQVWFATK